MIPIICPAYFPNVKYFANLLQQKSIVFSGNTFYQKQTFRNRTVIYGANKELNLIIPKGEVLFVFVDDEGNVREEKIGENNNVRITVPPGIWFGFKGLYKKESLILNISNIIHDDKEVLRKNLSEIKYDWNLS